MKHALRTPESVCTPSGMVCLCGLSDRRLRTIEKENGSVPLLAVIAVINVRPSLDNAKPYGCGSTPTGGHVVSITDHWEAR